VGSEMCIRDRGSSKAVFGMGKESWRALGASICEEAAASAEESWCCRRH
jgi:hypothetical protein